jgi:hypothetical protein
MKNVVKKINCNKVPKNLLMCKWQLLVCLAIRCLAAKKIVDRHIRNIKCKHGEKVAWWQSGLGQASVEFVIVAAVIMIIVVALASVVYMAANGELAKIISLHASHDISTLEGLLDVALY